MLTPGHLLQLDWSPILASILLLPENLGNSHLCWGFFPSGWTSLCWFLLFPDARLQVHHLLKMPPDWFLMVYWETRSVFSSRNRTTWGAPGIFILWVVLLLSFAGITWGYMCLSSRFCVVVDFFYEGALWKNLECYKTVLLPTWSPSAKIRMQWKQANWTLVEAFCSSLEMRRCSPLPFRSQCSRFYFLKSMYYSVHISWQPMVCVRCRTKTKRRASKHDRPWLKAASRHTAWPIPSGAKGHWEVKQRLFWWFHHTRLYHGVQNPLKAMVSVFGSSANHNCHTGQWLPCCCCY